MAKCFLMQNGGQGVGLNYAVKSYASEEDMLTATHIKENTIGIITDTPINNYTFSATAPGIVYNDIDYTKDVETVPGYYSSTDGGPMDQGSTKEVRIEEYFPVSSSETYSWIYSLSAANAMWFSIVEYTLKDDSYVFAKRNTILNGSNKYLYQSGSYTPSASNIAAVRISWRTFDDEKCSLFFGKTNVESYKDIPSGEVWIKTTSKDSLISFQALKKEPLYIYPVEINQFINNNWEKCNARIYQGGIWKDFWNGQLYENGNRFSYLTGGWKAWAGTLSEKTADSGIIYLSWSGATRLGIQTINKIDLTNFTKLHVLGGGWGENSNYQNVQHYIQIGNTPGTASGIVSGNLNKSYENAANAQETVIDIESITGEYYIYTNNASGATASAGGFITKCWLE